MLDLAAYRQAVAAKRARFTPRGLKEITSLHPALTPLQAHGVDFALRAGTAALFYDTGLGKTLAALDFGRIVAGVTGKPTLMLSPLGVAGQHQSEAEKFGISAKVVRDPATAADAAVWIANYEILDRFDPAAFGGVVLDESSILKSFTGATTRKLIAAFAATPFRLACTATPAPNDHTELGTHAEFLGVMRRDEMLTRWFVHDSADTGTWRLKGHASDDFWSWVASWARAVERPSDLDFSDEGYVLPPIHVHDHTVTADISVEIKPEKSGQVPLFRMPESSATSVHHEKKLTLASRADMAARVVAAEPHEAWIVWVETDAEEEAMTSRLPDAVAVRGSHPPHAKESRLMAFTRGETRILITKPSIAGFGLNWQHCARQVFVGLSFSYEMYYQAIRRCWRYGQKRPVNIHVVGADTERAIRAAILRKQGDHQTMKDEMRAAMRRAATSYSAVEGYQPERDAQLPAWLVA